MDRGKRKTLGWLGGGLLAAATPGKAQRWPGRLGMGAGFQLLPTTAANLGMTATKFAVPPTVQFHAQTSNKTMRPNGTFTGYISGTTLTISSFSQSTVRALVAGIKIIGGAAAGTTIVQPLGTGATGIAGTYAVNISQTVGSSSSPVTFTVQSDQINYLQDLRSNGGDLSADSTGNGPVLMQDGNGVAFLRFVGGVNQMKCWLRNLTYNLNGGTDSHNMSWIMAARIHDQSTSGAVYIGFGAKENTPVTNQANFNQRLGNWYGQPTLNGSYNNAFTNASVTGMNRMFLGTQLQILGSAIVTDNGVNNATNAAQQARIGLNETSMPVAVNAGTRAVNVPGFTLNSDPTKTQSETSNGGGGYLDLYELAGWLGGEFGTRAQMPARFDAAMAAMQANYSIPPIGRSLIIGGDSRSAYASGTQFTAYASNDGTQTCLASLLGERGYSWSLPANTRIIPMAFGGQGIGMLQGVMDSKAVGFNYVPRVSYPDYMLAGGNDYVAWFMDVNDAGDAGLARFPSTAFNGGRTVGDSQARGDDMFDGATYTGSATVTISANSTSLSTTGESGTLTIGSQPTTGSYTPGLSLQTGSGTPYTTTLPSLVAHSSETTSFQFLTYKAVAQKFLARGFKVAMGPGTGTAGTAALTEFKSRVLASLTDLNANPGGANAGLYTVFDLTRIQVGGTNPLGANFVAGAAPYAADQVHMSEGGRRLAVTGGDTPQYGYSYAVRRLMGLVS